MTHGLKIPWGMKLTITLSTYPYVLLNSYQLLIWYIKLYIICPTYNLTWWSLIIDKNLSSDIYKFDFLLHILHLTVHFLQIVNKSMNVFESTHLIYDQTKNFSAPHHRSKMDTCLFLSYIWGVNYVRVLIKIKQRF